MTQHDPRTPEAYPRRVLAAISGLSPQVITETLYGLLTQERPFVPTEIHIITTQEGKDKAAALLADPKWGLSAIWADYGTGPVPAFDPAKHIHLLGDADQQLGDVTESGHHVSTADTLLSVLRPLALDPDCAIHASLAGGRKTMSFYMGYVMSLLAREQDSMSHVLIDADFEKVPQFSYKPRTPREMTITDRNGNLIKTVNTDNARIALAPVPFVRMADILPNEMLEQKSSFNTLLQQAQMAMTPPMLVIDAGQRRVALRIGGTMTSSALLTKSEFNLYLYMADCRKRSSESAALHYGTVQFLSPAKKGDVPPIEWNDAALAKVSSMNEDKDVSTLKKDWSTLYSRDSMFSRINNKLKKALGVRLQVVAYIHGPRDHKMGEGLYGLLGADPGRIHYGSVDG